MACPVYISRHTQHGAPSRIGRREQAEQDSFGVGVSIRIRCVDCLAEYQSPPADGGTTAPPSLFLCRNADMQRCMRHGVGLYSQHLLVPKCIY